MGGGRRKGVEVGGKGGEVGRKVGSRGRGWASGEWGIERGFMQTILIPTIPNRNWRLPSVMYTLTCSYPW